MLISLSLPRLPNQTPLFTHSLSTYLALSTRSLITAIEGEDRTWLIDTYPPRSRTCSLQMISLSPTIHSPNPNQTAEDDDQPISRGIQRLSLHLNPPLIHPDHQVTDALELQSCASRMKLSVSTQQLSDYMRGKHRDI
ncbi:Acyl-coenzyme A oxidase, peroxisomal [Camellia lanceoleosa]|uniref:Acyl-coenzyme A oxidase, peroxisomal n=1 Tax=Camellia lanceoleosa TaxID=1840588 RepID=A0ACC0IQZ5_9ERIC|nr:Acyl-coenzyme A oxidase, peroxisomal [Camellia lanceoleosa]